jgi:hypothetical protein
MRSDNWSISAGLRRFAALGQGAEVRLEAYQIVQNGLFQRFVRRLLLCSMDVHEGSNRPCQPLLKFANARRAFELSGRLNVPDLGDELVEAGMDLGRCQGVGVFLVDRLVYLIDPLTKIDRYRPCAEHKDDNESQGDAEATPEPDGIVGCRVNSCYHQHYLFGLSARSAFSVRYSCEHSVKPPTATPK